VPRELADIVMRLLKKAPDDRFKSAGALRNALASLSASILGEVSSAGFARPDTAVPAATATLQKTNTARNPQTAATALANSSPQAPVGSRPHTTIPDPRMPTAFSNTAKTKSSSRLVVIASVSVACIALGVFVLSRSSAADGDTESRAAQTPGAEATTKGALAPVGGGRIELAKAELSKAEAKKVELAKAELSKAEAKKAELAKAEAKKAEHAKAELAKAEAKKAASLMIEWTLESNPPSEVSVAGGVLGTTPQTISLKVSKTPVEVVFAARGYVTTTRSITPRRDRDIGVLLKKERRKGSRRRPRRLQPAGDDAVNPFKQ
jgi:hypothetical protein